MSGEDQATDELPLLCDIAGTLSTDSSSNTNSASDEKQFIPGPNDILERPKSNPFQGGKIPECENDVEFLNIFQGILIY